MTRGHKVWSTLMIETGLAYCPFAKLNYGVTKKDTIRNKHVRGSVKVAPVSRDKEYQREMLKWYEGRRGQGC